MTIFRTIIFAFLVLLWRPLTADTIRIDVAELASALATSQPSEGELDASPLQALLLDALGRRLELAGLQLYQGELLLQRDYEDTEVEGGCNNTSVRTMQLQIVVAEASALSLDISSLAEPVSVRVQLLAQLDASGRARQEYGIRLGSCQPVASDSFDFTASGQIDLDLQVQLLLNPQTPAPDTILFTPQLNVAGRLVGDDISVQVEGSVLRNLLEDFLESEIGDALSSGEVDRQLDALQQSLQRQLSDAGAARIELQLPAADDEQIAGLYRLLAGQSRLPLTLDFVRDNRLQLLVALLTGDGDMLSSILTDAAGCEVARTLALDLPRAPLYHVRDQACAAIDPQQSSGPLYEDAQCLTPLDFQAAEFVDYCQLVLSEQALGNAAANPEQLGSWMFSAGNTLDISARPIAGLQQPYVQRARYKTTFSTAGACELEMRIYSPRPGGEARGAILAFHGGSWQYRATGFVGLEVMATHLTNAGYVVFAPFYRLLGDRDGPLACRNVQLQDVLDDGGDALDWVLANSQRYGAGGAPALFGQSAGAHIAAALAVSRAAEVARAGLFYGPVDFADFIENLQSGDVESETALEIIETVAQAPLAELNPDTEIVAANSFPSIVADNPQSMPPLFIVHGELDDVVPFSQGVRLCNALSGDPASGPAPFAHNMQGLRRIVSCDARGSQLHLIAQGEHALDICIADGVCASGDRASAEITADSIGRLLDWLSPDGVAPLAGDAAVSDDAGAGAFSWRFGCGLLLLVAIARRRQNFR